jgi:hypothetical protein
LIALRQRPQGRHMHGPMLLITINFMQIIHCGTLPMPTRSQANGHNAARNTSCGQNHSHAPRSPCQARSIFVSFNSTLAVTRYSLGALRAQNSATRHRQFSCVCCPCACTWSANLRYARTLVVIACSVICCESELCLSA